MSDKFHIPHDETAERAFVGGLILDEGRALDELPDISLEMFHAYLPRMAMEAILTLHGRGVPCGNVAMTQHMASVYADAVGKPVDGGWPAAIVRLIQDAAYGQAAIARYHGILAEQLTLRRLHGLQTWLSGQFVPGADPLEIMQGVTERLADAEPQADAADHALPGVVDVILREIDDQNAGREPRILRTPLTVWNDAFGGLPAGAYLALGGRPGARANRP